MGRLLPLLLLSIATMVRAQPQFPSNLRPNATPPTFPQQHVPQQKMPPDTAAPPPQTTMSSAQIAQQIQEDIGAEPSLVNTNVRVKVDESNIILTGVVDNENQHQSALRIAQAHAGQRRVVDKIEVKGSA